MSKARGDAAFPIRAFALGLVCGMRSLLGPALIRPRAGHAAVRNDNPLLRASQQAGAILPLLSAGELVADKLPSTPDRTNPPSVVFRSISGALVGSTLSAIEEEPIATGAILGLVGALVATFGVYHLRRAAHERTGLPSAVLGAAEDAAAVAIGIAALHGVE